MMNEEKKPEQDDEISLIELIQKIKSLATFLISKWVIILLAGAFGGAIGFGYAFLKPVKYTSTLSFVVEDGKSGAGGLASLAGQFGVDLGGAGGGGVMSGENVLLFLKSEGLVRQTLLTSYDSAGKLTLADRYADVTDRKESWIKNDKIGLIDFSRYTAGSVPRKEDSLMQEIIKTIIEEDLEVSKPDIKATFIELKVTTKDELLSMLFSERLVKLATDRYIESKTKTKAINIARLQLRADSLAALLNNKTYDAASTQQSLVDANPALRTAPIASEISSREKMMAATIFSEVVKNLEISKTILNQETPVIQMVDQSTLPLPEEKAGKLMFLILGGILAEFLTAVYLLVQRWLKTQLAG
jgi:hypothetical protein